MAESGAFYLNTTTKDTKHTKLMNHSYVFFVIFVSFVVKYP